MVNNNQKKTGIDIVSKVLEACYAVDKDSLFLMSLMHQYEDRGFLTKKQLQGLHDMARKMQDINTGWLATIEAMIAKLPNRDKSPILATSVTHVPDEKVAKQMDEILSKYPQHKAVLLLQSKFKKEHELNAAEKSSLEKFYKLLIK
jgi:hypothetical protein